MIPRRKKREPMGVRQSDVVRCAGHLQWVRGHGCCVDIGPFGCIPVGSIEAAHVRSSKEGGVGIKPGDDWTVSLCAGHHSEQHQIGERAFEEKYRIDMQAIAKAMWLKSPHRRKYELALAQRSAT